VLNRLRRFGVGVIVVATVLGGLSGPAFAAGPPGPSGRPPVIAVFDANGNQVKDPAQVAKVLAGTPAGHAISGSAISASGIDDYCPAWGGPYYEYSINNVMVHLLHPCQWLNTGDTWEFGQSLMRIWSYGDLEIDVNVNGLPRWWHSDTVGSGATQMRFQTDANLVLYTGNKRAVWSSNTPGWCGSSHAVGLYDPLLGLQEDSNFVIYCGGYWVANGHRFYVVQSIWSTDTISW